MKRLSFSPGRVEWICYPTHNDLRLPLEFTDREVRTVEVRDMSREPLQLEDFLKAPMIRRGRRLLSAIDLALNEPRQFYLDAMKGQKLPALRLGLYDPSSAGEGPLSFIPRLFPQTEQGMTALAAVIRQFRAEFPHKWTGNPYRLAIFPEAKPCRSA